MRSIERRTLWLAAFVASGCETTTVAPPTRDAGASDVGRSDAAPMEALDAGLRADVATADDGVPDAGRVDVSDAGRVDVSDAPTGGDSTRPDVPAARDAGDPDATDAWGSADLGGSDATVSADAGADCAAPANATAARVFGACRFFCRDGFVLAADACAAAPTARLVFPPSGATVTSRRPPLRWALGGGADGARVEVCRDRACSVVVTAFDAAGASGRPPADLPTGTLFWRVRARTGAAASAAWSFTVGARSAAVSTAWGHTLDVNGDGARDLAVLARNARRVAVFHGGGSLGPTPDATLAGPGGEATALASEVVSAGDINGDGYGDVLLNSYVDYNRVTVYLGGAAGLALAPAGVLISPEGPHVAFGYSMDGAGDVNGDGYADVVVGAPAANPVPGAPGRNAGRIHVYYGGPGGLGPPVDIDGVTSNGGTFGEGLGWSVAGAGDINGDGYADFAVGAPAADSGHSVPRGVVYLYLGGPGGVGAVRVTPSPEPPASLPYPELGFGSAVAGMGDVNGDGYSDLFVGHGPHGEDRFHVYLGGPGGLAATGTTLRLHPETALLNEPGTSFAGAGDVNGDGYSDFAVGDLFTDGAVHLYLGGAGAVAATSAVSLRGRGVNGGFGASISLAGDLDRDGYDDLAIGSDGDDEGVGAVYVFFGGAGGPVVTPSRIIPGGDGPVSLFGAWVASAARARCKRAGPVPSA